MKCILNLLCVCDTPRRVAFASIMTTKGSHIAVTILKLCNTANPCFHFFSLEISGAEQPVHPPPGIRHEVFTSERSTAKHSLIKACVHCVRVRIFNFSNDIGQWDSIDPRDD